MKQQNIDNLYSGLTSHELAAMSFKAMSQADVKSRDLILNAVPRFNYEQPDVVYTHRVYTMFDIANMWSIEYWKADARMFANMFLFKVASKNKNKGDLTNYIELYNKQKERIFALLLILDALEASHMLDKETVLIYAEANEDHNDKMPLDNLGDDTKEYYNNYMDVFTALLDDVDYSNEVKQYFRIDRQQN